MSWRVAHRRLCPPAGARSLVDITIWPNTTRHSPPLSFPIPLITSPPSPISAPTLPMATPRAWTALARSRPTPIPSHPIFHRHRPAQHHLAPVTAGATTAPFSTTIPRGATSEGPPPANFRLSQSPPQESVWDRAGNYFLLTEMVRGMYVVLEQFFRPPYALPLPLPAFHSLQIVEPPPG